MERKLQVTAMDMATVLVPINRATKPELPTRDEFIAACEEVKNARLAELDIAAKETKCKHERISAHERTNIAKEHLLDIETRLATKRV